MKTVADCWIEDGGRLLLVKAGYRSCWQFPGGHAEEGETPRQTAAREVREEVGTGVRVTRLLVLNTETGTQGRADAFCFLFAGRYDGKTPIVIQQDELSEYAWVPVEAAEELLGPLSRSLFPHARRALSDGSVVYLEGGNTIDPGK